jgi:hypothetical protein
MWLLPTGVCTPPLRPFMKVIQPGQALKKTGFIVFTVFTAMLCTLRVPGGRNAGLSAFHCTRRGLLLSFVAFVPGLIDEQLLCSLRLLRLRARSFSL